MSEAEVVTYELDGEVALIGLNRPDKRNALNPPLREQLLEAVLRAGEEAKCAILYGHGPNFCAGLDLAWAAEQMDQGGRQPRACHFATTGVGTGGDCAGRVPVIAALHGATLGGGFEMAASAHIRVADETTYFGLPEGRAASSSVVAAGAHRPADRRGAHAGHDVDRPRPSRRPKPSAMARVGYVVPAGQSIAKAKELAAKICQNAPLSNFAITNSCRDCKTCPTMTGSTSGAWFRVHPQCRVGRAGASSSSKIAPRVRMPESPDVDDGRVHAPSDLAQPAEMPFNAETHSARSSPAAPRSSAKA